MRQKSIGANKDDFERNLTKAIDDGDIRLSDVDEWLGRVEGWGNQHVYLYNINPKVAAQLTPTKIRNRAARDPELQKVWDGQTVLEFPDEPELTSISFKDGVFQLVWQEASPAWTPVPEKNIPPEVEGVDIYEYRAYRMVEHRAITRFEARPALGLAALFIATPIMGEEHKTAVAEAERVIAKLIDLAALQDGQIDISVVSRNADQTNVPTNRVPSPKLKSRKARLKSGDAYVEFASSRANKAYWEEPAVLAVRGSVKGPSLRSFQGSEGIFVFPKSAALSQDFGVQLYGGAERIRLWAQMTVDEVWSILEDLGAYQ